jgi:hypothetical protein
MYNNNNYNIHFEKNDSLNSIIKSSKSHRNSDPNYNYNFNTNINKINGSLKKEKSL